MINYKFKISQLKDITADLLKLFDNQALIQKAGLELSNNDQMKRWALQNWLTNYHVYGIEIHNELAGIIIIYPVDNNTGEIGYFLKNEFSGHHVMTNALHQVLLRSPYQALITKVEVNNKASQHVLLNNRFINLGERDGRVNYEWRRLDS